MHHTARRSLAAAGYTTATATGAVNRKHLSIAGLLVLAVGVHTTNIITEGACAIVLLVRRRKIGVAVEQPAPA